MPTLVPLLLISATMIAASPCPISSAPVVCLGAPPLTPQHGQEPCECPPNYACTDSTSKTNCTLDSWYCDCQVEQCAAVGTPCSTGADCCTDDVPPGYSVYCGGLTPADFVCSLKLETCGNTTCGQGATGCCGSVCLTEDKCCDPVAEAHGRECCGKIPYDGGETTCCSGKVVPTQTCCHDIPYNPDSGHEQCCPTGPCTIPPGQSSCCP